MESKYKVYWISAGGIPQDAKLFNDFKNALACYIHLSKKHERVVLEQRFIER